MQMSSHATIRDATCGLPRALLKPRCDYSGGRRLVQMAHPTKSMSHSTVRLSLGVCAQYDSAAVFVSTPI